MPFIGIQNAVTSAPQNLSLAEAIKAYTINGAYVMRQENTVGCDMYVKFRFVLNKCVRRANSHVGQIREFPLSIASVRRWLSLRRCVRKIPFCVPYNPSYGSKNHPLSALGGLKETLFHSRIPPFRSKASTSLP